MLEVALFGDVGDDAVNVGDDSVAVSFDFAVLVDFAKVAIGPYYPVVEVEGKGLLGGGAYGPFDLRTVVGVE